MSKRTLEQLDEAMQHEISDLNLDSQEELFSIEEELSPPASPDIFIEDAITAHMRCKEKQAIEQLTVELEHIQKYMDKFEERKNVTLMSMLSVTPVLL